MVAGTAFMNNLDGVIVQTAAPAIARDLGVRATDIGLVATVYLLALAVGIPAGGWLADRYGARRVFLWSIVAFTAASGLCAVSQSLPILCAVRVAQGLAGALMVPIGRLAVLRTTRPECLLVAMAYLTWPALLAPVIAPALGGLAADTIGWRWIFLANLPLGAFLVIAASFVIPRDEDLRQHPFDAPGFALVAVLLVALLLGCEWVADPPTIIAAVILLAIAATMSLAVLRRLRRAEHPLLDLGALRYETFRAGNLGGGVYRMIISALPFLYTLLFQIAFGWSGTAAGLMVVAVFVGNIAIKPLTTPLIRRLGFRSTILASNMAGAAICIVSALVDATTPAPAIALLLFFGGVFRSIGFTGYNSIQFADVPPAEASGANTLAATLQQIALGLGVAVATLLARLGVTLTELIAPGGARLGYSWAFIGVAALLLLPLVEAWRLPQSAGAHVSGGGARVGGKPSPT